MNSPGVQRFDLKNHILTYDRGTSILYCKSSVTNKKIWAKKINDIHAVLSIIEDQEKYYIACEQHEKSGKYIAVNKTDGHSTWDIPGRIYMNVIYKNYIYLIFIDDMDWYYLLKVTRDSGNKLWHHRVSVDLCHYTFSGGALLLEYESGKKETLSLSDGRTVHH